MANWYIYNGVGDPFSPNSYRLSGVKPSCVNGSCKICAIYLNEAGTVPSTIDDNVLIYMVNTLASQTSQPGGGAKRFVYVKNC